MFFPEPISQTSKADRVLETGPRGHLHRKAEQNVI